MSMFINAVSALGNNSGIYPLLVRDCGIEASSKVVQAYNQNAGESKVMAKHAARERIIDEYGTSLLWFGGIPAVECGFNKIIKKIGFNPSVSYKLLENTKNNQTIDGNIEKFKNSAPKEIEELQKIKLNKKLFGRLAAGKLAAALTIPAVLMGFVLPKANFALTSYLMDKDAKKGILPEKYLKDKPVSNIVQTGKIAENNLNKMRDLNTGFTSLNTLKKSYNPPFKGLKSTLTGLSQQQKMAAADAGLSAGRIGTARTKNERIENGFKMAGMMYLNYAAPQKIEKGLNFCTNKLFGINSELDPKITANKRFLAKIRSNTLELPQCQEDVLDFLDNNPKSVFAKAAEKSDEVKYLENGARDPRLYVDAGKVFSLSEKMKTFGENARNSGDAAKYAKKALYAKTFNVAANIIISSSLLAFVLPQAQYALRRVLFKNNIDPGLVQD